MALLVARETQWESLNLVKQTNYSVDSTSWLIGFSVGIVFPEFAAPQIDWCLIRCHEPSLSARLYKYIFNALARLPSTPASALQSQSNIQIRWWIVNRHCFNQCLPSSYLWDGFWHWPRLSLVKGLEPIPRIRSTSKEVAKAVHGVIGGNYGFYSARDKWKIAL